MKQNELDPIVKEIATGKTRMMIDQSLRDIQEEVFRRTGHRPSTSVLSLSLHRIGAKANGRRWIWQHNKGRHE